MRLKFHTSPWAIGAAVVAALALIPISMGSASAASVSGAHHAIKWRVLHVPNGLSVKEAVVSTGVSILPKLPHGLQYASHVTVVKGKAIPAKSLAVTAHGLAGPAVLPDSATGCTPYGGYIGPHTCTYVNGSGLKFNYWTTATTAKSGTVTAFYDAYGRVVQYDEYTGAEQGWYVDYYGYEGSYIDYIAGEGQHFAFESPTKACNYWYGSQAGTVMPCVSITR